MVAIMNESGFEEVEHTADWALRIWGRDLQQLYLNAARGLCYLLAPDAEPAAQEIETEINIDALDAESLLVNWLTELAYWAETDGIVFHTILIDEATPTHLHALVRGLHVAELQKHVKAVTYHNLQIVSTDQGLETTVVFDV